MAGVGEYKARRDSVSMKGQKPQEAATYEGRGLK